MAMGSTITYTRFRLVALQVVQAEILPVTTAPAVAVVVAAAAEAVAPVTTAEAAVRTSPK